MNKVTKEFLESEIVDVTYMGGDFVFRLRNERDELAERYGKLEAFLSTEKFNQLDAQNKELLREQFYAMKKYLSVLNTRLDIAKSNLQKLTLLLDKIMISYSQLFK